MFQPSYRERQVVLLIVGSSELNSMSECSTVSGGPTVLEGVPAASEGCTGLNDMPEPDPDPISGSSTTPSFG